MGIGEVEGYRGGGRTRGRGEGERLGVGGVDGMSSSNAVCHRWAAQSDEELLLSLDTQQVAAHLAHHAAKITAVQRKMYVDAVLDKRPTLREGRANEHVVSPPSPQHHRHHTNHNHHHHH